MKSPRILIRRHKAKSWHTDLRLEHNGVFLSWAIPKCLPDHSGTKHLAIKVSDHDLERSWSVPKDLKTANVHVLSKSRFKFTQKKKEYLSFKVLKGKFKGNWHLIQMKGKKNLWLIEKR